MAVDPSGIPGFDRARRSATRWRAATLAVVLLAAGAVARYEARMANLEDAVADQSQVLAARTPAIDYIEAQGEQQACVDKIEAEWQTAIANVVLAAVLPEPVPGVPPPPQPEDFAEDLRNVLARLRHLDPILPRGDQLCPLPAPPTAQRGPR